MQVLIQIQRRVCLSRKYLNATTTRMQYLPKKILLISYESSYQLLTISISYQSCVLETDSDCESKNHQDPVYFWDVDLSIDMS